MKILVISGLPWRNDNSFGNTYSNWFSQMEDIEIAHICLADGLPTEVNNVSAYFQVSENALTKTLLKAKTKKNSVGKTIRPSYSECIKHKEISDKSFYSKILSIGKKYHPPFLYLVKECIWKFGNINYNDMFSFIKSFQPDIIFMSLSYACFLDRVALKIYSEFKIPIVLEASIDVYTLKQFSFFPSYWLKRFWVRYKSRQICKVASLLYVISEKQRLDYSRIFNLPIKVMYKFADIKRHLVDYNRMDGRLRYLYTGNLGLGRWETLSWLANALKNSGNGYLDIYTPTALTASQIESLSHEGVCSIYPPISPQQVIEEQNKSDILVHVESFSLKNKLEVRYSISTKIMDYISTGRCIFAIGPSNIASMEYLKNDGLALIANNKDEVINKINEINSHPEIIDKLANKSLSFAIETLDEKSQRLEFFNDLYNLIK